MPLAKYNSGDKTSRFYILNAGGDTTDVVLTGYTSGGGSPAFNVMACANLAPNARCQPRTPTTVSGRYAVRVTAAQPLAVVVAEESHSGATTYKVQHGFAGWAESVYVPQVKYTSSTEYTTLAVQNMGNSPTQVTVSYYGGGCSWPSQSIPANGYGIFQADLACLVGFVGAARVSSGGQPLAVLVNEAGEKGYSGFLSGSQTVVTSRVRRDVGWWTGIRVMNVDGGGWTSGTIYFYNSDGSFNRSETFSIWGGYNSTNLGSLVPTAFNGSAVIIVDRPVVASVIMTLNGSTQQTMMTNTNNR